jgi:hypothetical protein
MIDKNETISIGWIDNGTTEGEFCFELANTIVKLSLEGKQIKNIFRNVGSSIPKQRQELINQWMEPEYQTDWLLFVDSDIILTKNHFDNFIKFADKNNVPILSSLCFTLKHNKEGKKFPEACIYKDEQGEENYIAPIRSFPNNELIKIDYSGLGMVMIHKAVIEKIYKKYPNIFLFQESANIRTVGEDLSFFKLIKDVGIQSHCHTGINPKHLKKVAIDLEYIFNGNFGKIEYE